MDVVAFLAVAVGGLVPLALISGWHESRARYLKGKPSPHGIVSLALAGPRRSEVILQAWRRPPLPGAAAELPARREPAGAVDTRVLHAARAALRIDVVLVAAYVSYLVGLAWLGRDSAGWDWRVVAVLGIAAGVGDLVENALLLHRVRGAAAEPLAQPSPAAVRATQVAAYGKFLALGLAVVALVAIPGLLPLAAVALVAGTVAAARHKPRRDRERRAALARERTLLASSVGPVPDEPPRDIDDRRWRPNCDVVLKGGITSGVIYPPALLRLARDFRFRAIGGTSAGAIAAACAAAAEHGRQRAPAAVREPRQPRTGGFTALARVHRSLGEPVEGHPTLLRSLFQAERRTRPLLRLFEAAGGERTTLHRAARVVRALVADFWPRMLLIALTTAAALVLAGWATNLPLAEQAQRFATPSAVARYLAGTWLEAAGQDGRLPVEAIQSAAAILATALLGLTAVVLAGGLTGVLRIVRVDLPENLFGICSGRTVAGSPTPGLTDWLAATIDELAHGPAAARPGTKIPADRLPGPLTFGDLWGVDDVTPGDLRAVEGRPPPGADVVLELVTTCLTEVRPLRLPYDVDHDGFWFSPSELARLFPEHVVNHLVDKGVERLAGAGQQECVPGTGEPLLPLPRRADLPVVVAVRMSLSLPLVLSAVPLWHRHGGTLEHCWFSDGGLTSNFPIHLFDAPVPRWPTFGFNLRRWSPGVREPLVEVPGRFEEGADPYWLRIGEGDLGGFVSALMDSARSWADETLSRRPGYRERIAHVYHSTGEGGMNLDMDAETITALGDRGYAAADVLARRYLPGAVADDGVQVSWNSHRWARASITLAAVGEYVEDLRAKWDDGSALAGEPSYRELVANATGDGFPPQPFPLTFAQRSLLRVSVQGLRVLARPLRRLEHGDGSGDGGRGVRRWGITLLRPSTRR